MLRFVAPFTCRDQVDRRIVSGATDGIDMIDCGDATLEAVGATPIKISHKRKPIGFYHWLLLAAATSLRKGMAKISRLRCAFSGTPNLNLVERQKRLSAYRAYLIWQPHFPRRPISPFVVAIAKQNLLINASFVFVVILASLSFPLFAVSRIRKLIVQSNIFRRSHDADYTAIAGGF